MILKCRLFKPIVLNMVFNKNNMKKKYFVSVIVLSLLLSGCSLIDGEGDTVVSDNSAKLYDVYHQFQTRYDAQKAYVDKNSFDTVGQSDLKETEKNLAFVAKLLNDGVACSPADYQYSPLGYYFPWYKSMYSVDKTGRKLNDGGGELSEFCYSSLSDSSAYTFKKKSAEGGVIYTAYGYWPDGSVNYYMEAAYPGEADCKLGEWTDAVLKMNCTYEDKDKVKKEDEYSYDFFFKEGALINSCTVNGDQKVCKTL